MEEIETVVKKRRRIKLMRDLEWSNVERIVKRASFTLIPGEWYENNPVRVIESLCLGTPILGSKNGGIPELINEQINGIVFEAKNSNALINSIERMYQTEFNYQQIAEIAQKKFSSEEYYNQLMNIYNIT